MLTTEEVKELATLRAQLGVYAELHAMSYTTDNGMAFVLEVGKMFGDWITANSARLKELAEKETKNAPQG